MNSPVYITIAVPRNLHTLSTVVFVLEGRWNKTLHFKNNKIIHS